MFRRLRLFVPALLFALLLGIAVGVVIVQNQDGSGDLANTPVQSESVSTSTDDTVTTQSDTTLAEDDSSAIFASETLAEPVLEIEPALPPADPVPGQVVLRFTPDSTVAEREAYIDSLGGTVINQIDALNTVVVSVPDETTLDAPQDDLLVTEADYYVSALINLPTSDPSFNDQWGLSVVGAPGAWDTVDSAETDTVIVAVIDSGVCTSHPDLQGRVVGGWDFIENDSIPQDAYGHGCAVAGIIGARVDNGTGIAGIAPHARIMPLRVLDANGIGEYSDVAEAIVYAVDNGAEIINISLGGLNESGLLQDAIIYAHDNGALVIGAAGNTGSDAILYPAAYPQVVAVGAVDRALARTSFSSSSALIDLYAPGQDILSTATDGTYDLFTGTSFAAPHVSGVAAIEMVNGRELTLDGGIVAVGGDQADATDPIEFANDTDKIAQEVIDAIINDGSAQVIISLHDPVNANATTAQQTAAIAEVQARVLGELDSTDFTVGEQFELVPAMAGRVNRDGLNVLEANPAVRYVYLDYETVAFDAEARDVLEIGRMLDTYPGLTGAGVTVAVIDSGVNRDSPGLRDSDGNGSDLIDEKCFSTAGTCPGGLNESNSAPDDGIHGTLITNIITSPDGGAAPDADIVAIRVLDANGRGSSTDWINALEYVLQNLETQPVQIVNMSLGTTELFGGTGACDSLRPVESNIVNQLVARGVAIFAATGNQGNTQGVSSPACLENVIGVGAVYDDRLEREPDSGTYFTQNGFIWPDCADSNTQPGQITCFTNSSPQLELVAPGSQIILNGQGGAGTSQATPYAAAVAALMLEADATINNNTRLNVFALYDAITTSSTTVNDPRNGLQFPLLNAFEAVENVVGLPPLCERVAQTAGQIGVDECEALVSIYESTDGPNWANSTNWNETITPCTDWFGVTCDGGSVTELSLPFNDLSGTLPDVFDDLPGLTTLDLSDNFDLGGAIPSSIGDLSNLVTLNLSFNDHTGTLPASIGNLGALQTLDLSFNDLEGTLPASITNMGALQTMDISVNNLNGTLPDAFSGLTNLVTLNLSDNNLRGSLPPSMGDLSSLVTLDLEFNRLNGDVPAEIGTLPSLEEITLSFNDFGGTLPNFTSPVLREISASRADLTGELPAFDGQTTLQNLDFDFNEFTGEIPTAWMSITSLVRIDVSDNLLTGQIPDNVGNLTGLESFDVSTNLISGEIPTSITNLNNLISFLFNLDENLLFTDDPVVESFLNGLTGWQDTQTPRITAVNITDSSSNSITIDYPTAPEYGTNTFDFFRNDFRAAVRISTDGGTTFDTVREVEIDANTPANNTVQINGLSADTAYTIEVIPFWRATSGITGETIIAFGDGAENTATTDTLFLSTCVTTDVPVSECEALQILYLSLNIDESSWNTTFDGESNVTQICGVLNGVTCNATDTNVTEIDLFDFGVNGAIPPQIADLTELTVFNAESDLFGESFNNVITGLPAEIGDLANLEYLLLNSSFEGILPPEIGNLSNLIVLEIGGETQTGGKASGNLPDFTNLTSLTTLDIMNSDISGSIPSSIASATSLNAIRGGFTQLSGPIPNVITNLPNLQYIDLNGNNLSGTIPANIGNIPNLWYLGLDDNNLTGTIPASISNANALGFLLLRNNDISGTLPDFTNLSNLIVLGLSNNNLEGSIPDSIGNLTSAVSVDLDDNNLSGSLPATITNLTSISGISMSYNNLSGDLPDLSGWSSAQFVDLSYNAFTGPVPGELNGTTSITARLYLNNNQFDGPIPPGLFARGGEIDLSNNLLTGTLPEELFGGTTDRIRLGNNLLSGLIDFNIANVTLTAGNLSLAYNGLYTQDAAVLTVMNSLAPFWTEYQIIGPQNVTVAEVTGSSITLDFTPIDYSFDFGFYEAGCSVTPGGPYDFTAETEDKSANTITINELQPETLYYCAIRTVSQRGDDYGEGEGPEPSNFENGLVTSEPFPGEEVSATTTTLPVIEIDPDADFPLTTAQDTRLLPSNPPEVPTGDCVTDAGRAIIFSGRAIIFSGRAIIFSGSKLTVDTSGSNYDTALSIWSIPTSENTGDGIPDESQLTLEACNDDDPTLQFNDNDTERPPNAPTQTSRVEVVIEENTDYYIIVYDKDGTGGDLILNIDIEETPDTTELPLSQLAALTDLYVASGGNAWADRTNWVAADSDPCTWAGVTCTDNNVTGLDLGGNNLVGTIPASITDLTALTTLNLSYNGLNAANATVANFVIALDSDWQANQTVPPTNVQLSNPTTNGFDFSWTPITYTGDAGTYQLQCGLEPGGPYVVIGRTFDKNATGFTAANLLPGTTYYCTVQTFTEANANLPQDILSDLSDEVSIATLPQNGITGTGNSYDLDTDVEFPFIFSAFTGILPLNNDDAPTGTCSNGAGRAIIFSGRAIIFSGRAIIFSGSKLTADTQGTDYDNSVSIWSLPAGSDPDPSQMVEEACSNTASATGVSASGLNNFAEVTIEEGRDYYVVVEGNNGASGNLQLEIDVNTPDSLSIAPDSLTFTQLADQSDTQDVTLSLTNDLTVNFSAIDDATNNPPTWLSFPTTVNATAPTETVILTADSTGLAVGTYTATVTASAAGLDDQTISVTLTVTEQPMVVFTPDSASFTLFAGETDSTQINVSANDTVSLSVDGGTPAWLTIPSEATGNFTVSVDSTGLAPGTYTATITGTAPNHTADTLTVTLTVTEQQSGGISSFTLIDARTNQPIPAFDPIPNGATINLADLPTDQINIRANADAAVDSVRFALNGNNNFRTENAAPFALAGDSNSDYRAWDFTPGAQNITATPYSEDNARGTAGTPTNITFTLVDASDVLPVVTGLTLIDTDSDQPIPGFDPIPNNAVINVDELPSRNLSIRANTNPFVVDRVRFDINGVRFSTEGIIPYAIAGDNGDDFLPWAYELGTQTITTTPTLGDNTGAPLNVTITLTENQPTPALMFNPAALAVTLQADQTASNTLTVLANGSPTVNLSVDGGAPAWLIIPPTTPANQPFNVNVNSTGLAPGVYTATINATADGFTGASAVVTLTVQAPAPTNAVTSFTLINTDSGQPIAGFDPIPNNAVINLATLPSRNLNIRANTNPAQVGSVRFGLNGNANFRMENGAPYMLAGNQGTNFFNWNYTLGAQSLIATPFSESNAGGTAGTPLSINFTIVDETVVVPSLGFNPSALAVTLQPDQTASNTLTVLANGNPTATLSVDGGAPAWLIIPPTTPANQPFNVNVNTAGLAPGVYTATINATADGFTGASAVVTLTVEQENTLTATFTLINADTDQPIAGFDPIPENAVINLNTLPTTNLNIRVDLSDESGVESVLIGINEDANVRIENFPPFAVGGNNGADYNVWNFTPGIQVITITTFSENNAQGIAGTPITFILTLQSGDVAAVGVVPVFTPDYSTPPIIELEP